MNTQLDMLLPEIPGQSLRSHGSACETLKRHSLAKVETNAQAWLRIMRAEAIELCQRDGSVSTDELRLYAEHTLQLPEHDNWWGGVFRGPRWKVIGRRKSRWASNHAREIKVWVYVRPAHA